MGDVTSGAAFDGTQGTTLTFNDADGDQTIAYDTTNNKFNISDKTQVTRLGVATAPDANRLFKVSGDVSGGVATIERTNVATNASLGTMIIKATSSGNMADGFASAFQFAIEDNANVENLIADIRAIRDGADDSGLLSFNVKNAGSMEQRMTLSKIGTMSLPGSSTQSSRIQFAEDTDNGTNTFLLFAPSSISSDITNLLPDTSGTILNDGNTATVTNKTIASSTNVLDSCLIYAVGDDFSNLTTGTGKLTFRMPYAMTVTAVRMNLVTAATGGTLATVDINEEGTTILSTKLTTDASEKTSTTAATAAVVSDSSLADDAEITVDIDAVGNTTPGNGLKIQICGTI